MTTTQIEFISVNPGNLLSVHDENRKKVRIQVMKDFRRKERERQAAAQRHSTSPVPEPTRSVSRIPPQIRSPQLNQTALTQKLRDGWYPVGFGFSTLVPADVRRWGPVLAILDSMKLVHLGSCVRDEQLLVEGRKRFLLAMNCLQGNLGHEPSPSVALPGLMLLSIGISMTEVSFTVFMLSRGQREAVLQIGAALILTSSGIAPELTDEQIYNAIYDASIPTSWQKHIVGMSALLLKQRPIDVSSPLEVFMVARIRGAQLLQSLCTRQPFPVEYAAPSLSSQSSAIDFVLDLAFKLPPLLSSTDTVMARATNETSNHERSVHYLARVVRDLLALKKMLDSWLKTFCEPTENESALYSRQKQKKRTLPDVTAESLCRICLLLIHQAVSDLHNSHHSDISSRTRAHEQAALCVEDLYQTTVLLSEIAERPVSKAIATCGPLHFLCNYYQSVGDNSRLERCYEMIKSICAEAPYLNWDMLLPWSLLPLTSVRGAGGPLTAHLAIPPSSETADEQAIQT